MLKRQREGSAKAKREGRYKGRVPTARRQSDADHPTKGCGKQPGHRQGECVSGVEPKRCAGGRPITEPRVGTRCPTCGGSLQLTRNTAIISGIVAYSNRDRVPCPITPRLSRRE
jgi:hypothetical protein